LIVALSSTKAEFIAAAECVKEIMHLKALLKELAENSIKITLNIDNQRYYTNYQKWNRKQM